ncbi:hypothetical protein JCM9279_003457 [Rhodotorula babjevae]
MSHGRHRSTSGGPVGGSAQGEFRPPPDTSADLYDVCNAFWSAGHGGRRDADGKESDWGRDGYETVLGRVKSASKGIDDLRTLLKERASASEDYAKRLVKLSKHPFGTGETGHMERAQVQLKNELESSAKSQQDLAQLLRQQEATAGEFAQKRDSLRKAQQQNVEKLWKNLLNQRAHVVKAKEKYEADAIQINALHAQASLLQGKELDKVSIKLDKVQQSVEVNERDYKNYANVLKQTTAEWNMAWKAFCDLVQDQEEERLEFVKSRMWDYANGLSAVAMQEDESAERTRTALEQCDPKVDIRIFVSQFGTGNLIPDPVPFVDVKAKEAPPKQGYKSARFIRSSTRIPGAKHSPSAVGDITRALGQQQVQPPRQGAAQPMQMSRSGSQPEAVPAARPQSRSANRASNPNLAAESVAAAAAAQAPSPQQQHFPPPPAQPSAPPPDAALSPSRFSISPSANLRARPSSEHITPASTSPAKPGHMSAGAFQNRLSLVSPSLGSGISAVGEQSETSSPSKPARYEPPAGTIAKEPSSGPFGSARAGAPPANGGMDDDENDPLLVALKALQAKPPPSPSRQTRSSVDLRGAAASPTQQQPRPASRGGHYPQQSFGSAAGAARSRPTSPAPGQAFMQPPPSAQQRPRSPSIPYMQPSAQSRPHSRAGSNISAAHLTSPPPSGQYAHRPASPSQHVPARGRSPSPQPFIPESLRPASPNPAMQAQQQQQARSPSVYGAPSPQQPALGYGAPPQQQQPPAQQQYSASQGYGTAPPPQQAPYGQPAAASSTYGHGRATSPAPQGHGAPYHQPPPLQQPYLAQAPSQPQLYQSPPPSASPYQHGPPQQQHVPPTAYGYGQPPPQQQQQQQAYARSPSVVGGYGSPASSAPLGRTNSMLSGVSGASTQQTPAQMYQAPPAQQQQQQQQQAQQPMQQARPPSVADLRAGQAQQPPPTGQHTETGQPILFYVNALYDYAATSAEEFSFSTGDVIAVTGTDPDGWWHGQRVGDPGSSKLFPSNFTELLP